MILGSRPPLPPVIHRVGALLILYRYIGICDRHRRKVPSFPYSWCSSFVARGLSGVLFVSFTHCSDPSDHLTSGPRREFSLVRDAVFLAIPSFSHLVIWSCRPTRHTIPPLSSHLALLFWVLLLVRRRSTVALFFSTQFTGEGVYVSPRSLFLPRCHSHSRSFLLPLTEPKCAPGD